MRYATLFLKGAAASMLSALLLHPGPAAAAASPAPAINLDGRPLSLPANPVIENGQSLVPMRAIFEAEGAQVAWDGKAGKIAATKDGNVITYRLGDSEAYRNGEPLQLPTPGRIIEGAAMVPLRFVSETLGNVVQWYSYSRSITISTAKTFETNVTYGVRLRTVPDTGADSAVMRLIPTGERIHVIREIDGDWLEVQTGDRKLGFVSAKPKYTDYTSPTLAQKQGEELIAFGSAYLGTPYEFGASSDQTATFDCSSFVKRVFAEVLSVDLPRVSYDQAKEGKEVSPDDLRVGDLLFFSARGLDIGHVGIYAGDGKILHTYSKEQGVHFEDFSEKWKKRFVTARRMF